MCGTGVSDGTERTDRDGLKGWKTEHHRVGDNCEHRHDARRHRGRGSSAHHHSCGRQSDSRRVRVQRRKSFQAGGGNRHRGTPRDRPATPSVPSRTRGSSERRNRLAVQPRRKTPSRVSRRWPVAVDETADPVPKTPPSQSGWGAEDSRLCRRGRPKANFFLASGAEFRHPEGDGGKKLRGVRLSWPSGADP